MVGWYYRIFMIMNSFLEMNERGGKETMMGILDTCGILISRVCKITRLKFFTCLIIFMCLTFLFLFIIFCSNNHFYFVDILSFITNKILTIYIGHVNPYFTSATFSFYCKFTLQHFYFTFYIYFIFIFHFYIEMYVFMRLDFYLVIYRGMFRFIHKTKSLGNY